MDILHSSEASEAQNKKLSHRIMRTLVQVGRRSRRHLDRFFAHQSEVGNPSLFDQSTFGWSHILQDHWRDIEAEMQHVLHHQQAIPPLVKISPDHQGIAADGKWRSYFIWAYGVKLQQNAVRCPRTTTIVEQIPGLTTAMFSILEPRAHIKSHTGVTKAIVIGHLGLKIPKDQARCRMWLDGQTLNWEEGKVIVFDDTYQHEVWNDTDEERVVLLIHVRRPMRFWGHIIGGLFLAAIRISPFITDAKNELGKWEKRFRASEKI